MKLKMILLSIVYGLATATALASCGGGGGGATSPSAETEATSVSEPQDPDLLRCIDSWNDFGVASSLPQNYAFATGRGVDGVLVTAYDGEDSVLHFNGACVVAISDEDGSGVVFDEINDLTYGGVVWSYESVGGAESLPSGLQKELITQADEDPNASLDLDSGSLTPLG